MRAQVVDRGGQARSAASAGVLEAAQLVDLQQLAAIAPGPARSAGEGGAGAGVDPHLVDGLQQLVVVTAAPESRAKRRGGAPPCWPGPRARAAR